MQVDKVLLNYFIYTDHSTSLPFAFSSSIIQARKSSNSNGHPPTSPPRLCNCSIFNLLIIKMEINVRRQPVKHIHKQNFRRIHTTKVDVRNEAIRTYSRAKKGYKLQASYPIRRANGVGIGRVPRKLGLFVIFHFEIQKKRT